jgi:DNA primase
MNFESFDIIRYLQEKKIPYSTEGKNVTSNWIEVNCPFCSDPSFHLGISPTKKLSCWICGTKGSIVKYVQEIENCGIGKAHKIIEKYQDRTLSWLYTKKVEKSESVFLPKSAKKLSQIHKNYLTKRKFDPEYLERKYDLLGCNEIGEFKFRIIIPVYYQNQLVTFLGRDITGKSPVRYKNCPVEKSVMPTKSVLYNLDSIRKTAVIVEGVTDVWRIGEGAIATFGTQYTKAQLALLIGLKRVFILFDSEAQEEGNRLAYDLSVIIPSVETISLPQGDPAELDEESVKFLRKELNL